MEFLLYLTPVGQQIMSRVISMNYTIRENAPICRNKEIFGYLKSPDFTVCLDNIKNKISPVEHYVNETVYHEAVHIAQACKKGKLGMATPLNQYKLNDVMRSVKITGGSAVYEMEAYYLEDKPEQVLHQLKKYCL